MRHIFLKQESEKYPVGVNFEDVLLEGESISSAVAVGYNPDDTVNLDIIESVSTDGPVVLVTVKEGTDGFRYKITVSITTSAGSSYEEDIFMRIKEV